MSAAPKLAPPLGRMPTLQFCRPVELHIDPSYQRNISTDASQSLIKRIAAHWNWDLCQPLVVARRQGMIEQLFVIDGQHRLAAARLRRDIDQLPCVIVNYASATEEAANFVHLNQQRRPLTSIEIFKAAVASGDQQAAEIVAVMEAEGLTVAPHTMAMSWKPGMVSNIGGIKAGWKAYGPNASRIALYALSQGFQGQIQQYAGTIYPGLLPICAAIWLGRVEARGDRKRALVAALKTKSQLEWRQAILRARADDAQLSIPAAARAVIQRAIDALSSPPEKPAIPAPPAPKVAPPAPPPAPRKTVRDMRPIAPTRLLPPGVTKAFQPVRDGKAFCTQCDCLRSAGEVVQCTSKFCDLRRA